ncbi:MAG: hypothetical protein AB8B83_01660 [Bdellovibrionales bacterium]
MKNIVTTLVFTAAIFTAPLCFADDFGTHFTDQTPLGFSDIKPNDDSSNIDGMDLNTIEPAAGGDEENQPTQDVSKSKENTTEIDQPLKLEEISL